MNTSYIMTHIMASLMTLINIHTNDLVSLNLVNLAFLPFERFIRKIMYTKCMQHMQIKVIRLYSAPSVSSTDVVRRR